MTEPRESARRTRIITSFAVASAAALLCASSAGAHIERASYWPDPAADTAGGQPTGGEVPTVRPLASALDPGAVGTTRVVCQGGQSLPYRANQDLSVSRRPNQEVSRARVNRLERKLRHLRRAVKKAEGAKTKKKKKKAARAKKRLKQAKLDYRAALAAEQLAREQSEKNYQAALAAEQAARDNYESALGAQPSFAALDQAIAAAKAGGYEIRPSEPRVVPSDAEAAELRDTNARLLANCAYNEIQPAITDSGNNDRVVVMPGVYTEPTARAVPTDPPPAQNPCEDLKEENDRGQTGANSYAYIAQCPNDANLLAVIGREPRHDQVPQPPLLDRHEIPDEGPCIRCNFQIEGSGVGPDDVVVDAGDPDAGNGADPDPVKHVGIKVDRADGFVLSNMTFRHVSEHAIYVHETDGYVNQRFKTFHAHEYGTLQFASDHGLIQDCQAYGSGDAGIYPGSAPDTGEQVQAPDEERFNTEIRRCDMNHNAAGYSGTAANAVWLHNNDFYDNALGFTTDVFTAAGHPGFPQDSDLLEDNEFYDNNFNPYVDQPDEDEVVPTIPVPVGTGMWIAGGNNNEVRNNRFWDNWRRGAMLFAVPDALVCGPAAGTAGEQVFGCDETEFNTSYRNEFHNNVMGQAPDGTPDPNGTDFWWDEFLPNTNNCWVGNTGVDGTRASLTAEPPINPAGPGLSVLGFLPEDCATQLAGSPTGYDQEAELVACLAEFDQQVNGPCTWFDTPSEPPPPPRR